MESNCERQYNHYFTSKKLTVDLQKLSLKPMTKQSTVDPEIPRGCQTGSPGALGLPRGEEDRATQTGRAVSISDAGSSP